MMDEGYISVWGHCPCCGEMDMYGLLRLYDWYLVECIDCEATYSWEEYKLYDSSKKDYYLGF